MEILYFCACLGLPIAWPPYFTLSFAQVLEIVIIGSGLGFGLMQYRGQNDWVRKQRSLEYSLFANPEYASMLGELDSRFGESINGGKEISLEDIEGVKTEYPNVYRDIHCLLARLEYMAIAINNKIADELTCQRMLRTRTIHMYQSFQPFIKKIHAERGNEKAFSELKDIVERWKSR